MHIPTDSPIYQKAFEQYLRNGTPLVTAIKRQANQQRPPTPRYTWVTAGDEKVRPSHAANDLQIFSWDDPPPTGNPGDEPGCRCTALPYVDIHDIVPMILAISVLGRGRAALATLSRLVLRRVVGRDASQNWQLGRDKSDAKWNNQIEQGNWTPEKITEVIKRGIPNKAINKKTEGPATRYQLGNRFVVRDDTTGDVLQVSRPGMKPEIFK